MTGAYTAKPADVADPPDIPDGWNPLWPFPGPNPPGHTPVYGISFVSPPTPDNVAFGEEITVRVKMYEEGLGDSKLGTIAPNVNIDWSAFVDGFEIDSSSKGWAYDGFYYSSWTFTPSLIPSDFTNPPKLLTIDASGTMNNGSFSQQVSIEDTIEIMELDLDISGGLLTATFGSDIWAWYTQMQLDVYDGDSVQISHNVWRYRDSNAAGGPVFELRGESWGSVPAGAVASIWGAKGIQIVVPSEGINSAYTYKIKLYAVANDESSVSITTDLIGDINIVDGTELRSQITGGDDPPTIIDLGFIIGHSGIAEFQLSPTSSPEWEIIDSSGTYTDLLITNY